jgi:hypothetical protein
MPLAAGLALGFAAAGAAMSSARFGEDRPAAVMRSLGAFDDAAARVAAVVRVEVVPAVLLASLLETAAAGDAGDRRESSVTY